MGPEPRNPGQATALCGEANWEDVATNIKQRLRGKGPNPTLEKLKFCSRTRLSQLHLFLVGLRYFFGSVLAMNFFTFAQQRCLPLEASRAKWKCALMRRRI